MWVHERRWARTSVGEHWDRSGVRHAGNTQKHLKHSQLCRIPVRIAVLYECYGKLRVLKLDVDDPAATVVPHQVGGQA